MQDPDDGNGICPHCQSSKPFFATTCHACNKHVGFWAQCAANTLHIGGIFLGMWLIWEILKAVAGA